MVEVSESIGKPEIVNLLIDVLKKIADQFQKDYSNELIVAHMVRSGMRYDPRIIRVKTKTRKWMGVFPLKTEERTNLILIDTGEIEGSRRITVYVDDIFVFPIAKEEITKFASSNIEVNIKVIDYIKNFSSSP
ncbi:MAG: hypothetical protein WC788_06870 [Candidatus Paceibacterota bacterium]|jgi:hypothetical protein